jgi:signal transduction histidine kinase
MFNDRNGNIWIGTDGAGIGVYSPQKQKFGLVGQIELSESQTIQPFVRCFLQDSQSQLWIGTYNSGLICWKRDSNTFLQLLLGNESGFPSANDIYCLSPYDESHILAGTSSGLWAINLLTHEFFPIEHIIPGSSIQKVTCIVPNGSGGYELLVNNKPFGLLVNNGELSISQSVFPDTSQYDKICTGSDGALCAFSRTGFFTASKGTLKYKGYFYKDQKVKLKVNAVYVAEDSLLWVATNHGLLQMNTTGTVRQVLNESNGFHNHYFYGVLSDNRNNLWISSNRGLSEFNMENGHIINYGMGDGLQSLEFNSGAYYKNTQGEMFFGGVGGFNYFFPDSIHHMFSGPPLYIRNILVNDFLYEADSCWMAKKSLELSYNQNTVTFELETLDFTGEDNNAFKYMLVGHDKDWISTSQISRIRYSKLSPGEYSFEVLNENTYETPDGKPLILKVKIQKPFWMKAWFLAIVTVAIIAIIILMAWYFTSLKMKRQIASLERQNEISQIRSRIASDLHDDVGSGLSRLAMMSDKARLNLPDKEGAGNYLLKLSTESRRMIDQLRVIVWALNPQEDKLDGLIAYLHGHIRDFLEDFPVRGRISITEDIPHVTISPEFKRNVYYAIREAVHNAVKHAEAGDLEIQIIVEDKQLKIVVEDNGRGFDFSLKRKSGNGIPIMEKRITDLNGMINISAHPGKGTCVAFNIPL